jgi:hypothetical protein
LEGLCDLRFDFELFCEVDFLLCLGVVDDLKLFDGGLEFLDLLLMGDLLVLVEDFVGNEARLPWGSGDKLFVLLLVDAILLPRAMPPSVRVFCFIFLVVG